MAPRFQTTSVLLLAENADGELCSGTLAQLTHSSPVRPYHVTPMSTSPLNLPLTTIAPKLGLPPTTTMRGLLDMINSPTTSRARKDSIRGLLSAIANGAGVEMFAAPAPTPLAELHGMDRYLAADRL